MSIFTKYAWFLVRKPPVLQAWRDVAFDVDIVMTSDALYTYTIMYRSSKSNAKPVELPYAAVPFQKPIKS
jgi:hypothetical protein